MLRQSVIVYSIARSSEDFQGHATLRCDKIDEHLFPIGQEDRRMMALFIRPFSMDAKLADRIASSC